MRLPPEERIIDGKYIPTRGKKVQLKKMDGKRRNKALSDKYKKEKFIYDEGSIDPQKDLKETKY